MGKSQKYFPTAAELAIIHDNYDGSSLRLSKIMRLLDRKYPRWYVRRQAGKMGLARVVEPDWTAAEESYVSDHYPRMGLKALRAGLIRQGWFPRSTTAIHIKITRLGITADRDDGFTLRGLCNLLWAGQEMHHIISRWQENGWLKGHRRGTLRKAIQGGDHWYFSPEWVRAFVIAHPEEIDIRLVDKVAFISLVAGDNLTLPAACKCPGCGREFKKRMFNPGLKVLRVYCDACKAANAGDDGETYRVAIGD